jgi:hypothetical protein
MNLAMIVYAKYPDLVDEIAKLAFLTSRSSMQDKSDFLSDVNCSETYRNKNSNNESKKALKQKANA